MRSKTGLVLAPLADACMRAVQPSFGLGWQQPGIL
ncbi:hypothetical protein A8924_2946 [Saccharopolyspora erythraea NRRL 2338]|nr:hypothetical protein A8924_2946 [Saccharopolyspora erythraea NRRL 2338]